MRTSAGTSICTMNSRKQLPHFDERRLNHLTRR